MTLRTLTSAERSTLASDVRRELRTIARRLDDRSIDPAEREGLRRQYHGLQATHRDLCTIPGEVE